MLINVYECSFPSTVSYRLLITGAWPSSRLSITERGWRSLTSLPEEALRQAQVEFLLKGEAATLSNAVSLIGIVVPT
jgi:hypothetical protein